MEMADYWLDEKQLVHKLFKVLVPRYETHTSSFTKMYLGPREYPGYRDGTAILELKGNIFQVIFLQQNVKAMSFAHVSRQSISLAKTGRAKPSLLVTQCFA